MNQRLKEPLKKAKMKAKLLLLAVMKVLWRQNQVSGDHPGSVKLQQL
jgi:hypothetical protein